MCEGGRGVKLWLAGRVQVQVVIVQWPWGWTLKWSPQSIFHWTLHLWYMVVQNLNDATLASLGNLKYPRWPPRWPAGHEARKRVHIFACIRSNVSGHLGYFRFPGDARVASRRFLTSRSHRYKILLKTLCGLYFMVRLNIPIWQLDYCFQHFYLSHYWS